MLTHKESKPAASPWPLCGRPDIESEKFRGAGPFAIVRDFTV